MEDLVSNKKLSVDQSLELIEELSLSTLSSVQAARDQLTHQVSAGITVRTGSVCDRDRVIATGSSRAIQTQGLWCVLDRPVLTGSVFHLTFEREHLDVAPLLAVCDKSIMLDETAFETHFTFAGPIDLSPALNRDQDS